jgi:uncharacterized membrane protein
MTDNDSNRYPDASAPAPAAHAGNVNLAGRKVPAAHGAKWIGSAWHAFKRRPLQWVGLGVLYMLIELLLSSVPFINLLSMIVTPLLLGGLMAACERFRASGEVNFGDLFAGFRRKLGPLALVGLLTLAIIACGMLVLMLAVGTGEFMRFIAHQPGDAPTLGAAGLIGLLVYALIVAVAMSAAWFAPALVVLHDVAPVSAMRASIVGSLRNWLASFVYLLLLLVLVIVGAIPFLLGWLIVIPLSFLALYDSYRDIFVER